MRWLTDSWYHPSPLRWLLSPLSALYRFITGIRRWAYQRGLLQRYRPPVPVIVVGNISVGGTGKTPVVIWLAEQLRQAGYQPGIISRGYGGNAPYYPFEVTAATSPTHAGDEPVLIARRSLCPVVVDAKRSQAAMHLLNQYQCNVIISDDGLQHYALQRDVEIILVDAKRRFGNQYCLPAGPLREPLSRLKQVDFIIFNGHTKQADDNIKYAPAHYSMQLTPSHWINLADPRRTLPLTAFQGQQAHAVAAIGHPQRFFDSLSPLGITVHPHAFTDHHAFQAEDIQFNDKLPILMTEKDAVKCQHFAQDTMWYLPVSASLTGTLMPAILQRLKRSSHG